MDRRSFNTCAAGILIGSSLPLHGKQDRIRIGQIGLAHPHASGKLKAVQSLPETYEIVGVVEPDLSLRKRAQGVTFVSLDKLMDAKGLQAVVIETGVKDLVTTATPLVEAGKHIHLDKPAGPSLPPLRNSWNQPNGRICAFRWAICSATTPPSNSCSRRSAKAGSGRSWRLTP